MPDAYARKTIQIPSATQGDTFHDVTVTFGKATCTCPGYTFHQKCWAATKTQALANQLYI